MPLPSLIDADRLAASLDDPALRLFDATVFLLRPPEGGPYTVESGRATYEPEHIPGAAFADVPGELSDPDSALNFTLPSAEHFAAGAGRLGIGPSTHVVVYTQDSPMWATRLGWLLRFFGFDAVSVLDGGLSAWREAGLELSATPATYPEAEFAAAPRPELLASHAEVERVAGGPDRAEPSRAHP